MLHLVPPPLWSLPPHFVTLNEVVTVELFVLKGLPSPPVPSVRVCALPSPFTCWMQPSLLHPLEGPIHLPCSPGEPETQLY